MGTTNSSGLRKLQWHIERQSKEIRAGGGRVLISKIRTVFFLLLRIRRLPLWCLAVPCVIGMRLLKPLVTIRLGKVDIGRIGGAYTADWYLCDCLANRYGPQDFGIFYFIRSTRSVSNHQWFKMWKRSLRVFPFWQLAHVINRLNSMFPGSTDYQIREYPVLLSNDDVETILAHKGTFLNFTSEEESFGESSLEALGIPKGKQFICFHSRDSAYLDAVDSRIDWSYHNYRDSVIHNYVPAIEALTERGYYGIRMGAIVKDKIISSKREIIDYAANGSRTDFMDIYLGAKCRFAIYSNTGIAIVPELFKRPMVYTNFALVVGIYLWVHEGLIIFKHIYQEESALTFQEIMSQRIGFRGSIDETQNFRFIENTPEEITAVALEMDARLQGTWETTKEDEVLQQRFWEIFGLEKVRSPLLRIGADFLRQNESLLV